MFILVVILFFTLSISFLCSLLESTLLSLSTTDIAKISERKPGIARIWADFKNNIQKPISVILIVNTLSHTIGATLSGAYFAKLFGPEWVGVFSLVFSLAMIQWTEILPKTLGVQYNRNIASFTTLPLQILMKVFSPFVFITHWINKPFERKKHKKTMNSLEEITILARFSSHNNLISSDQENIIARSIKLSQTKVKHIMISRNDIKYLSTSMKLMDALLEAHVHHHTRFPLILGNDLDQVIGYVNFKDIVNAIRLNPKNPSLLGISRPILEVSENEDLNTLMKRLIKSYQHIAIVKDAEKKTKGLVTLEDIFEFMIGDIQDEYDILPTYCYPITENRFVVGGGIPLLELREKISSLLPEENLSLSQWLIKLFNRVPKIEETIKKQNLHFIIRKIRRNKIYEVIIELTQNIPEEKIYAATATE